MDTKRKKLGLMWIVSSLAITGLSFANLPDTRYNEARPNIGQQDQNQQKCEHCMLPLMKSGEYSCICPEFWSLYSNEQNVLKKAMMTHLISSLMWDYYGLYMLDGAALKNKIFLGEDYLSKIHNDWGFRFNYILRNDPLCPKDERMYRYIVKKIRENVSYFDSFYIPSLKSLVMNELKYSSKGDHNGINVEQICAIDLAHTDESIFENNDKESLFSSFYSRGTLQAFAHAILGPNYSFEGTLKEDIMRSINGSWERDLPSEVLQNPQVKWIKDFILYLSMTSKSSLKGENLNSVFSKDWQEGCENIKWNPQILQGAFDRAVQVIDQARKTKDWSIAGYTGNGKFMPYDDMRLDSFVHKLLAFWYAHLLELEELRAEEQKRREGQPVVKPQEAQKPKRPVIRAVARPAKSGNQGKFLRAAKELAQGMQNLNNEIEKQLLEAEKKTLSDSEWQQLGQKLGDEMESLTKVFYRAANNVNNFLKTEQGRSFPEDVNTGFENLVENFREKMQELDNLLSSIQERSGKQIVMGSANELLKSTTARSARELLVSVKQLNEAMQNLNEKVYLNQNSPAYEF